MTLVPRVLKSVTSNTVSYRVGLIGVRSYYVVADVEFSTKTAGFVVSTSRPLVLPLDHPKTGQTVSRDPRKP
jgi:hypothetical protein